MPADVAATWLENDVSILDHSYGKEDSKLGPEAESLNFASSTITRLLRLAEIQKTQLQKEGISLTVQLSSDLARRPWQPFNAELR